MRLPPESGASDERRQLEVSVTRSAESHRLSL